MTTESLNQLLRASEAVEAASKLLREAHKQTTFVEGIAVQAPLLASYALRRLIDDLVSAAKCDGDNAPKPAVSTCLNCGGETLGSTVNVCRKCVDAVTMRKEAE